MAESIKKLAALEQKKLDTLASLEKQKQKIIEDISKDIFNVFSKTNSLNIDRQVIAGLLLFYKELLENKDQNMIDKITKLGTTIFPSKKQIQEPKNTKEANS
ncbi:hypothetical protein NF27_GZ00020 [Candidatus Jidaibacter acanthamoeba]|uniref:Uncharacterized protein n=1 Tax=Candidatus Jidaibacter acanthamoebae TaxID=86105 RepID=A0A0C1MRH7_9RICK|nr:hypothetical protein [Candidatus Jidaibacter acanthamoeba]KIE04642.1 hypothetical protein NF27_GZ00020 [Candidatus Jidaibacter acanthamoeba]